MENSILEFKRRREIYEYINHNSGLHMRDISRKLNIPFTSLKYHLNYLEKKGFIISRDDGKYRRYFISLEVGEKEKMILNCLRRRTTLHIILWFFIAMQCSQKDISRYLEKHPATISFHLRKMIQANIIEQVSIENGVIHNDTTPIIIKRPQVSSEKIYVLQDPWMIYELLIQNKENLGDKEVVTGIIEYVEFIISEGIPKQIQNREDTKESIVNTFYKFFFPPSFCS
jgi:DNA-binding MarR family transcriptional regulator